jgi:hypothetical protein
MDEKIKTEYFKRSYFAVDGLWFMMAEKMFSFDEALMLDKEVWSVLPKIQARKIKELLSIDGDGIFNFKKALGQRFDMEEYDYEFSLIDDNHIRLFIHKCPWLEIIRKSGRESLASKISGVICPTELNVWAKEFGLIMETDQDKRLCNGCINCVWDFHQ